VQTASGQFTYSVVAVDTVGPLDRKALGGFGDSRLTLVTGNPIFKDSHPLVVEALLTSSTRWTNAPPPRSAAGPGRLAPAVSGDSSAWYLVMAAIVLAVAIGFGSRWIVRRTKFTDWRAVWAVLIPILLVAIYVAFHALAVVLPATT
jgi:hypothetical protein